MGAFTIGKLAKLSETSEVTIRYYEKMGLLPSANRTPSGYRQYQENAVHRLKFIHNAKALGFTLNEIKELLSLHDEQFDNSQPVVEAVEAKLELVTKKINELRKIETNLKKLLTTCNGVLPVQTCPIMKNIFNKTAT